MQLTPNTHKRFVEFGLLKENNEPTFEACQHVQLFLSKCLLYYCERDDKKQKILAQMARDAEKEQYEANSKR